MALGPISRLGFGVTGPHASAALAPQATAALIRAAFEAGVTLFDTGPMYGAGEGERRLGAALKGLPRERVFICTKARTFPMRGADSLGDDVASRLRRSVEGSLSRLNVERVDALLLHGPRLEDLAEGLATLRDMKREGLVGAVGVCGRGSEVDAAMEQGVDVVMTPLVDARLARAAALSIPVLAIETMRGRAAAVPMSGADLWYLARATRDAMTGASAPRGEGIAAALAKPAVRSVIVQTTRLAHLMENVAAAS